MIKSLRPYQQEAVNALRARLKMVTHPIVANMSVGSGKSVCIAELLLIIERAGWRALCLTMNSTLISQNAQTYRDQGGTCGIYCAGLGEKNTDANIIFGSPHSVAQGIKNRKRIKSVKFNLIIIDECHGVSLNPESMYQRIFNNYGFHAQQDKRSFRILGLTGTPYRNKAESIIGEHQFFKEEAVTIQMPWLIENGYLVKPVFEKPTTESFDMSSVRVDSTGKFNHKELQAVIDYKDRLTGEIMREIITVVNAGRAGAFIFASTLKHAAECMRSLPISESALITGNTPHDERKRILDAARAGDIRYLVNVATLLVGVDVPNFDVCAWLRPTESLTLFTQGIGRVLRLSDGKKDAIVLDYCGNLERHGDIDDPIINEALEPKDEEDPDYCIKCYQCNTMNKTTARRCRGMPDDKRCDYYFEFKACSSCAVQNDITSRVCRACDAELIDPNAKLTLKTERFAVDVIRAEYWLNIPGYGNQVFNARYITNNKPVFESYVITERSKNIFYARFIRQHTAKPSDWYEHIMDSDKMKEMIYQNPLKTPNQLIVQPDEYGRLKLISKVFYSE